MINLSEQGISRINQSWLGTYPSTAPNDHMTPVSGAAVMYHIKKQALNTRIKHGEGILPRETLVSSVISPIILWITLQTGCMK